MNDVIAWLDNRPPGARRAALTALAIVPVLAVAGVYVAFPPAAPFVGCGAGIALFVAAYGTWHTLLSEETQAATDLKDRYELRPRRGIVLAALAVWIIVVLLVGSLLPDPVVGTMHVFVAISLYWVWKATPEEAAVALAAYEAAQQEKKAATLAAADEDSDPYEN